MFKVWNLPSPTSFLFLKELTASFQPESPLTKQLYIKGRSNNRNCLSSGFNGIHSFAIYHIHKRHHTELWIWFYLHSLRDSKHVSAPVLEKSSSPFPRMKKGTGPGSWMRTSEHQLTCSSTIELLEHHNLVAQLSLGLDAHRGLCGSPGQSTLTAHLRASFMHILGFSLPGILIGFRGAVWRGHSWYNSLRVEYGLLWMQLFYSWSSSFDRLVLRQSILRVLQQCVTQYAISTSYSNLIDQPWWAKVTVIVNYCKSFSPEHYCHGTKAWHSKASHWFGLDSAGNLRSFSMLLFFLSR